MVERRSKSPKIVLTEPAVKTPLPSEMSSEKEVVVRDRSMMYIIFASLLLDLLAFTMILPLFPSLMEFYRKNDPPGGLYNYFLESIERFRILVGAPDRYSSVLFGGALGSLFSFLQFLVSPLAGGLSDVFGRKPILLASLIGIAFSYVLWAVSHSFSMFVLARIIGGLSKGNVSLSMAAMTDILTPATRTSGMALVGIAFSIGFVVGPVIGAMFAQWASTAAGAADSSWFVKPALFALTLAVADIIFVLTCFRETLHKSKRAKSLAGSLSQAASYINVISLFKFSAVRNLQRTEQSTLQSLGLIYFGYLFVYSGLEFTMTFLTHHNFGFTPMRQGILFFWMGLTMAVLQGAFVRRIKQDRVKSATVLGLLLIIPSFIAVGLASNEYTLYFGVFLFAASTSVVVPCMTTLASQYGGHEQKGTVMGIFRSLGALARAIGPILASIAYWSIGSTTTYLVGSVALIWPWYSLKQLSIG